MDIIYNNFKKYKYAKEYHEDYSISDSLFFSLLQKTWEVTPSKNNIMPYKVHVLGPNKKELKEIVYKKCLENEYNLDKIDPAIRYKTFKPNLYNIVSCSYLLIFTVRKETVFNDWQKSRPHLTNDSKNTGSLTFNAKIEIGMFCSILAGMCFENNIDIGHTGCVPREIHKWSEPEFSFIDNEVILLMTIGKGKLYRRDTINSSTDLKPNFEKIVNFIN